MTETKEADAPTAGPSAGRAAGGTTATAAEDVVLIDLQDARPQTDRQRPLPSVPDLERWASEALAAGLAAGLAAELAAGPASARRTVPKPAELTLRIVGEEESTTLNRCYRDRTGATNILSFPFDLPPGLDALDPQAAALGSLLGDLIICAPVVQREAHEQDKTETAHWAHLVVHGVLHLLGFDHLTEAEASAMEALEIRILGALGFPSPYEVIDDVHDERRRI
ncbi:rRNA maturation RNase YbeY [Halochromatium glycolicum]|uniref:Endoribonuclease YbeY n=1 Tax=Halochromatium glycolicum TaxID=85075 RepID=A0AAJ0U1B7_9GAMM|nr:rRNA maturation RNase YbeY [Halochromatium glycolicum]